MSGERTAVARVLVVDDEALIRWSLGEQLSNAGYEVAQASDGASALDVLRSGEPIDVVILDLKLPDTDGLQVLAQIRRMSPVSRVVMMSAYATPQDIAEARAHGVTDIVPKPFDVDDLIWTIERELHRS